MAYRDDPRSHQQPRGGGRAPASYSDIDEPHYSSRGGRDLGRERGGYDDRRGGYGGGGGFDRGHERGYDRRDDYNGRDDRDRRGPPVGGDYRQPDARRRSRSPPPRRRDDEYSRDHRRSRSPPPSRYDSAHSNGRAPLPPRSDAGSARSRENDRVPAPRDAPREERNGKGKDKRERSPSPVTADDAADVDAAAMAAMMGFSGFDTTSHKHVQDDLASVAIKQPRTHRQYMNRKGGFNRPLDKIK